MELWRQCAAWLVRCRVLPPSHRVAWDTAQVHELAHALRDGVLLCQLLYNLNPASINLKDANLRPQMSQFFCLKNIRTFLGSCEGHFGMKRSDLFEPFDLFDLRDFAKVVDALSSLSHTHVAKLSGIQPFPLEPCYPDEDIYTSLSEEIDCIEDDNDDLYDCVDEEVDEGGEIYEDLMRSEEPEHSHRIAEVDKRSCCLQEIAQTEEKYSRTLESIIQHFMRPLQRLLQPQDVENIFINLEDLAAVHRSLLEETQHSIFTCGASNLHQVFINYKERLLLYGRYCSQVEEATKHLDKLTNTYVDIRTMLEDCSQHANDGRFSLRDLLMVPMQRVLKYHLLLQELVKHSSSQAEKERLCTALDSMRDLAQCVNEVKRDNEVIRQITAFQLCIENMRQSLAHYGRPRVDGELKICSPEKKSKQDRYAFVFDKAMVVCKRKSGDNMGLKEIVELQHYKLKNEMDGEKDKKWCHTFSLIDSYGHRSFDLYFKTKELQRKWVEQFKIAFSNVCPESRTANNHDFEMHCFNDTSSCGACHMLLRGIFYQGYRCTRCLAAAHKECLDRAPLCRKVSADHTGTLRKREVKRPSLDLQPKRGLPKLDVVQEYYGFPPPPAGLGQPLNLSMGDVVEMLNTKLELQWWEGRNVVTCDSGWFPSSAVQPFVPKQDLDLDASHWFVWFLRTVHTPMQYSTTLPDHGQNCYTYDWGKAWFAGNIDRNVAKNLLMADLDGTYLVRQKDSEQFAISIKFRNDVKHIKIVAADGLFRINERKAFRGLTELVDYYQQNSLKECFKELDTTLQVSYKEAGQNFIQPTFNERPSEQFLGWARALYDFCARDSSELSLRAGDDVRIISKEGDGSWWKGEFHGQVGLFPANYVEENYSEYC